MISKILTLALVLTGCATLLDDSDYARLEQSEVAYECAAYIMGVDAPGPVPEVIWRDEYWYVGNRLANGTYDPATNIVYVHRSYREGVKTLVHEMTHALQVQRGEVPNEFEAYKAERWIGDCINFTTERRG